MKYQRISLEFLSKSQNKYKIWNILRIKGTCGTPVSLVYEMVKQNHCPSCVTECFDCTGQLATDFHQPIIRKFENRNVYSSVKVSI